MEDNSEKLRRRDRKDSDEKYINKYQPVMSGM